MAAIGGRKKNDKTKEPKHAILRIGDLGLGVSPSRLMKLLREREMEPQEMLIQINAQRRVVAFVDVPENQMLNCLRLFDINLDPGVLHEDECRKFRAASGRLAVLETGK